MALTPLPGDTLAAVVTSLEMTERPKPRPQPLMAPLRLVQWREVDLERYRALFRAVGSRWLWFSRLVLDDAALAAIVRDPKVAVHVVMRRDGAAVGLLELDFREEGQTELAFFGLLPELTGRGFGGWLMTQALQLAWAPKSTRRVWVHTCTLDHPSALGFYQRYGFKSFARAVETFADPRLAGLLPRDAAPQVPLLGEPAATE